MSRHCSSVKSVGYDLSFIAPLPQNLTPTRRVNNSPDQMSLDNNCLKFSKPCNGHAFRFWVEDPLTPTTRYMLDASLCDPLPDHGGNAQRRAFFLLPCLRTYVSAHMGKWALSHFSSYVTAHPRLEGSA